MARPVLSVCALLGCLALLNPGVTQACMNRTHDSVMGTVFLTENLEHPARLSPVLSPAPLDVAKFEARIAAYEKAVAAYPKHGQPSMQAQLKYGYDPKLNEPHVDAQIDYGVDLAFAGQFAKARDVFAALEKKHPGQYAIAANLGTCYELTGDNTNALKWIREGMRRNPESHFRTEWLHAKILEAKLNIEQDPGWLQTHSVLGYDFGPDAQPRFPKGMDPYINTDAAPNRANVTRALAYQLGERLKFIRTPEPIVADLLTDLGNCLFISRAPGAAAVAYNRAKDYGATGELLDARLALASQRATEERASYAAGFIPEEPKPNPPLADYAGFAASGLTVLLGVLAVLFLRRKRLTTRST